LRGGFSFPRFLKSFLAVAVCFALAAEPVSALRQSSPKEGQPATLSGMEERLGAGAEEKWQHLFKPLAAVQEPTLHAEAEAVLRLALAGQQKPGLLGKVPVPGAVAEKFQNLSNDPVDLENRGRQALIEWMAYRWSYQRQGPSGEYYDTLAQMIRSILRPGQADAFLQQAKGMGIPVAALPGNFAARKTGMILPLYAARSREDEGIGDFAVLRKMIDWGALQGLQQFYLMPLMEIDDIDPSPYFTISAFAGNPLYIALREVPEVQASARAQEVWRELQSVPKQLRTGLHVDYPPVLRFKQAVLEAAYAHFRDHVLGKEEKRTQEFEVFRKENAYWLDDYALFRSISKAEMAGWRNWKDHGLRDREPAALEKWRRDHPDEIQFYQYVQFLFDEQLKFVRRYAHQKNIRLTGDMPGYVDGDASWVYRDGIDTGFTSGAQADRYSVVGQDWGSNTYNWPAMRQTGFRLAMNRMRRNSEMFDDVRMDYWVGYATFFRVPRQAAEEKWRRENLTEMFQLMRQVWDRKFAPEPFPLIPIHDREEFHRKIRESLMDEKQYPAPEGIAFDRAQFSDTVVQVVREQGRHTWGPNEPRYQQPAFLWMEGTYTDLTQPGPQQDQALQRVLGTIPDGTAWKQAVMQEFQRKAGKGDLGLWVHVLMRMLDAEWVDGPGHELMQRFQQRMTYGQLGEMIPEDFGQDFPKAQRLRRELGLPRIRPLEFGLSGFFHAYWDTQNHHPNSYTFTTTHDGPTLLGEILRLKEGNAQERAQLQRVIHALDFEKIPVHDQTPLEIHRAVMIKAARSRAGHVLYMYQDLMGLDNRFRTTPPGDALGAKWRDRMPMTAEDLLEDAGELAQRTNRLTQDVLEDPAANRRSLPVRPGDYPAVIGMFPQRGDEDGIRVQEIRRQGERIQAWAVVVPDRGQAASGGEPLVQMAMWNLFEDPDHSVSAPMRLYAVLPDGARLFYGELPAQRIGEFVLTIRVRDSAGNWHVATAPFQEPFVIVQPAAAGMEEKIHTVPFTVGEEVLSGSGAAGGSPKFIPRVGAKDIVLIEAATSAGRQYYFVQMGWGDWGQVAITEGGAIGFPPREAPVQIGGRHEVHMPHSFDPELSDTAEISVLDLKVSYDPDRGVVVSWGPDTPPFRVLRTQGTAAGMEEGAFNGFTLKRLAESVLHYRYGRQQLSPAQQFTQSAVARKLVEVLEMPPKQGYEKFRRLFQFMQELTTMQNLTELLGPQSEWAGNMPPSVVTADLTRIFSDLLRFHWGLRDRLYSYLVNIAVLSQDLTPQDMKLAVDLLRSAEMGEIVIAALQSNFSSTTGGMGLYIRDLTKGLAKMGANVTVIVPMFASDKEWILRNFYPRDTERRVTVQFLNFDGSREQATAKIYEARTEEGVRVLYLEQEKYFHSLKDLYEGSPDYKLRAARMLSLGTILAIREMKIHPSVIQSNDDYTGLIPMYLREGEPKRDGEQDKRGDDVDLSLNFRDDLALNTAQTIHVIHALAPGYNLTVYPSSPDERRDKIRYDLGRDPDQRNLGILSHPEDPSAISLLHAAIVHADHLVTVGQGFLEDSMNPDYNPLFEGFGQMLRDKFQSGAYQAIANGFDVVDTQHRYFSQPSFLEMGLERDRREAARRVFDEITPKKKTALQQAFGLPQNPDAFVLSILARVERTKGHHILTAPIWKRTPFQPDAEISWHLQYDQEEHAGFQGKAAPFEARDPVPLTREDHDKLIAYADRIGVDTLLALEVALVLMPDMQAIIAGPTQDRGPNVQIAGALQMIADRFGLPDGKRHFAFHRGFVSDSPGIDSLYKKIYTGSTAIGYQSETESFGLALLEAFAGGVPVLHSRRGGMRDMEISFQGIQSGFSPYHPVAWLQNLRHFYNVYKGNRPLWDEFRYWAIAERDFRGQARKYRDLYRFLYQRRIHGGIIPNVHEGVELPVLEMASAINRADNSGQPHPADELKKEGFSYIAAQATLLKGLDQSPNEAFREVIRNRYLPSIARIQDPALQQASNPKAGLEELSGWRTFVPSSVQAQVVHVLDPANADVGLFLGKAQTDPVVILAAGAEEERALRRAGFVGENHIILVIHSFDSPQQARAAAAALFPAYSPRFYLEEQRAKLMLWLAWILERYDLTQLTVGQAATIVEALSVLEAA